MTVAQWLLPQPLLEPHLPSLPLTDRSGSRRVRRAAGRVMGVQRSDPVHWLRTNVRHLLHRIDDLETKMAVLSSQSFATEVRKETFSVLILFIGYVQMFDIFFIVLVISR